MEGDCQQATDFLRSAGDFRHHTRGRQGDAATAELDTFGVHGDLHRVAHVVKIVQRLAHAHKHDIGKQPCLIGVTGAGDGPFVQIIACHHYLADDFGSGEVTHQFLRAGVAEGTCQSTAHLAGNAQGAAIGFGDIDDFYFVTTGDAHQVFAGAIFRDLFADHLWDGDLKTFFQLGTQGFGEICHLGEVAFSPLVNPLPDLTDPHLGLFFRDPNTDQRLAHGIAGHADEIAFAALGQLAGQGQDILGNRRVGGHGRSTLNQEGGCGSI